MFENIIKAILEITLYSSILIIIVLAIKSLFARKLNTKIMMFLWILILARLLLPITLDSPVHISQVIASFQSKPQHVVSSNNTPENNITIDNQYSSAQYSNHETAYTPQSATVYPSSQKIEDMPQSLTQKIKQVFINWEVLFCIWLLGMMTFFAVNLTRMIVFNKKIKACQAVSRSKIATQINIYKHQLNIKKGIHFVECDYVNIPLVYGLIRPTILIPTGFLGTITKSKINCIILHEMCHIKRKDALKNYLWLLAKTVYWFNPLVWFAYKSYLDDVEIGCDEMVLHYLNEDEKIQYTSSLLDVIKLSKFAFEIPVAVSFCKNKSKIRKRVLNILDPQIKSKKLAVITLLLSVVMIISCFTTACNLTQNLSTIEKSNVENTQSLENDNPVKEESTTNNNSSLENKTQAEIKPIQSQVDNSTKHMTAKLFPPSDKVTINVDTDVVMPNMDKLSSLRLQPENFTKEQFEAFAAHFANGKQLFYRTDDWTHLTEEEMIAVVPHLKSYLKENDLPKHVAFQIEAPLQECEKAYYRAHKKSEDIPYNSKLEDYDFPEHYSTFTQLKAYLGRTQSALFELRQGTENKQSSEMTFKSIDYRVEYYPDSQYMGKPARKMEMSYDDALALALSTVKALDGTDTNLVITGTSLSNKLFFPGGYTDESCPQAYVFHFSRQYNGATLKSVGYLGAYSSSIIDAESLSITIDDTGVASCVWKNYSKLKETKENNATLLDFTQIEEIFKEHCKNDFTWRPRGELNPKDLTATIDVKRIELNHIVMLENDKKDSYIVVPVWDFIADITYSHKIIASDGYQYYPPKNVSIVTINAIDGTIISREQEAQK